MVSLEVIAILLSGISISASLIYYASVLRNQNETRQTQLFMNVYNNHTKIQNIGILMEILYRWEWDDFDDFNAKYSLPNNFEAHEKWTYYFATLEGLGILIKKGLIDPELVYNSQWASIILLWEKFRPVVEEIRVRTNIPHVYEDPEFLYNEMIRIRDKKGHKPLTNLTSLYNPYR